MAGASLFFGNPPRNYNKKEKRFSVPFLSFLFLSDIFVFFSIRGMCLLFLYVNTVLFAKIFYCHRR